MGPIVSETAKPLKLKVQNIKRERGGEREKGSLVMLFLLPTL